MSDKYIPITVDGNYPVKTPNKNISEVVVYLSGNFGTATAVLSYADPDNNMIPLTDGAILSGEQALIKPGATMPIYLVVAGSDGTTNIHMNSSVLG